RISLGHGAPPDQVNHHPTLMGILRFRFLVRGSSKFAKQKYYFQFSITLLKINSKNRKYNYYISIAHGNSE
ncbi:hypothetical protein, partial [Rhizobium rhizogenes]|uniref:hypothetical protein n=1 Tax=Rhizobium rhizogenes TaxID=359 RepID=UPI001AEDA034